jgi:hypothetical protein
MPFSPFRLVSIFGYGAAAVAVAAITLLAAAVVFRFDRSWPSSLLLVGAVALFVVTFFDFAIGVAFEHGWLQRTFLMQGCLVTPWLSRPLKLIEIISYFL